MNNVVIRYTVWILHISIDRVIRTLKTQALSDNNTAFAEFTGLHF